MIKTDLTSFVTKVCQEYDLCSWVHMDKENNPFLIAESWHEMEIIEKYLREHLPVDVLEEIQPKEFDSYNTDCVDFCMDNNWGFADEYSVCDFCGHVIRTTADSYSWTPSYWIHPYRGIYCLDCVDINEYLDFLTNNPDNANTIFDDDALEEAGYRKVNTYPYEYGWYGLAQKPNTILKQLLSDKPDGEFIFSIEHVEQFRTCYDVWEKV